MLYAVVGVFVLAAAVVWRVELFALLLAAWVLVANFALFTYIRNHPWQIVMGLAAYFAIGAAWSVVNWWFAETSRARRARDEFKRRPRVSIALTWEEWSANKRTSPANYQSDILWWISFWPFSVVWTLLNDPFRRLCRRIYDELQGVYQRITDSVWR